ncbi:hypothetical protein FKM82_026460 [Ascaphus truei]
MSSRADPSRIGYVGGIGRYLCGVAPTLAVWIRWKAPATVTGTDSSTAYSGATNTFLSLKSLSITHPGVASGNASHRDGSNSYCWVHRDLQTFSCSPCPLTSLFVVGCRRVATLPWGRLRSVAPAAVPLIGSQLPGEASGTGPYFLLGNVDGCTKVPMQS